jgi:hypothetical protein
MSATMHGNLFLVRMVQIGLPKRVPPQTSQSICFPLLLMFFGAPLEHPSCAHQKMEQLKGAPKSVHSECSKYSFFQRMLQILFFCIRFWCTLLLRSAFEICKMALVLYIFRTPSLSPCWTSGLQAQNLKTSATLHGNAPAQNGTSAMLHGNAFRVFMVNLGAPHVAPYKCPRL